MTIEKKPSPPRTSPPRFVLVRPRNPENIGAAARALANFGFGPPAVVAPHPPVWRAAKAAMGAAELLREAPEFATLEEALRESPFVLGTDSGARRRPSLRIVPLPALERPLPSGAAILFGSEKTGLTNAELSYCRALLTVPTSPGCPSMNLGQAVACVAYELARGAPASAGGPSSAPAPLERVARLAREASELLARMNYLRWISDAARERRVRAALLRWGVTAKDLTLLHQAVRRMLSRRSSPPSRKL